MMKLYGGVEGGATHSKMVILDADGKLLGQSEGPHTNHWLVGMKEVSNRVQALTRAALENANLDPNLKLEALGLSLSGINTEDDENDMTATITSLYPDLAGAVYSCNDSVGAWATVTNNDAIVLIAGTGSICKVMRKNLKYFRVGGHGHFIGDEGSAFWIAKTAITYYINNTEGLVPGNYSVAKTRAAIHRHFGVKRFQELLPYFNEKFDKRFIAKLCESLAKAALDGDQLCKQFFHMAGYQLGQHVSAAVRHADREKLIPPEGLDVICCGSVFKSWSLIEKGFRMGLKPRYTMDCRHGKLTLHYLHLTAAYGAAALAAKVHKDVILHKPENATTYLDEITISEIDSMRFP